MASSSSDFVEKDTSRTSEDKDFVKGERVKGDAARVLIAIEEAISLSFPSNSTNSETARQSLESKGVSKFWFSTNSVCERRKKKNKYGSWILAQCNLLVGTLRQDKIGKMQI